MGKLTGKVALITGAGAGLGAGIAEAFSKHGAKMCLVDRATTVEGVAEALRAKYPGVEIITAIADVTNKEQLAAAAAKTYETFGALDITCANAGVCKLGDFVDMSDDVRDFHINVNIKGAWNTCQTTIPYMLKAGKGAVVIASSVTGDIVADPGESAYALTKAAMVGLTKALAKELGPSNVRVNCVAPGVIQTDMLAVVDPAIQEELKEETPLMKLGNPIDIAKSVCFLCSPDAGFITGQVLGVNGGFVI